MIQSTNSIVKAFIANPSPEKYHLTYSDQQIIVSLKTGESECLLDKIREVATFQLKDNPDNPFYCAVSSYTKRALEKSPVKQASKLPDPMRCSSLSSSLITHSSKETTSDIEKLKKWMNTYFPKMKLSEFDPKWDTQAHLISLDLTKIVKINEKIKQVSELNSLQSLRSLKMPYQSSEAIIKVLPRMLTSLDFPEGLSTPEKLFPLLNGLTTLAIANLKLTKEMAYLLPKSLKAISLQRFQIEKGALNELPR